METGRERAARKAGREPTFAPPKEARAAEDSDLQAIETPPRRREEDARRHSLCSRRQKAFARTGREPPPPKPEAPEEPRDLRNEEECWLTLKRDG